MDKITKTGVNGSVDVIVDPWNLIDLLGSYDYEKDGFVISPEGYNILTQERIDQMIEDRKILKED